MNINEMRYEFELRANKVASLANESFEVNEIDAYLNRAHIKWFKDRYGFDFQTKKGFETNQMVISELSSLHITSPSIQPVITPALVGNGIYKIELKDLAYEYIFLTRLTLKINKDSCTKTVSANLVQTDDMYNEFNKPDFKWGYVPFRFGKIGTGTAINSEKSAILIDTNGDFTVTEAYVDYLKYPNRVFSSGYDHIDGQSLAADPQISSDIETAFHDDIVDKAVSLAQLDVENFNAYSAQEKNIQINQN
jgi:hypothetical protein